MSVMTLVEFRDCPPPFVDHDGHCDCCGKRLIRQFVFWFLGRVSLALHRKCAEEFGGTLIYEARRAEAIARGKSPTCGISAELLRDLEGGGRERPITRNADEWAAGIAPREER